MKRNYAYYNALELQYDRIIPKIIAEEYIEEVDRDLYDYKFLCFNGEVHYCWVDTDRSTNHSRNVYNLKWELQEWRQKYKNSNDPIKKPENFDNMVNIAKELCKDFTHVRVDLYNVDGKIYFGEMTFTNANGFQIIEPIEYNLMLGELWKLPINKN